MTALSYVQGATLPDAVITVTDDDGTPADLTGTTLALRVGSPRGKAFDKTTGLTFAAGAVTVNWAATGEIGDLTPNAYQFDLTATAGGEHRTFHGQLIISPAVPATQAV